MTEIPEKRDEWRETITSAFQKYNKLISPKMLSSLPLSWRCSMVKQTYFPKNIPTLLHLTSSRLAPPLEDYKTKRHQLLSPTKRRMLCLLMLS